MTRGLLVEARGAAGIERENTAEKERERRWVGGWERGGEEGSLRSRSISDAEDALRPWPCCLLTFLLPPKRDLAAELKLNEAVEEDGVGA